MNSRFGLALPFLAAALAAAATAFAEPAEWKAVDAGVKTTLRSVSFADKDNVWAVGDSGAVLHSKDAGITWESVKTPSDGTLRGVRFIDRNHGYAVGDGDSDAAPVQRGHVLMGKPLKCGTFLATADGGGTWERVFMFTNFELRSLWMVNEKVGQICNHGGTNHPDGDAIVTWEGTRGWRSGRVFRALNDCFWTDEQNGWAVGSRVAVGFRPEPTDALYTNKSARIIRSTNGGKNWSPVDAPGGTDLRRIRFADKNVGVAVGDAGTLLRTADAGATWKAVDAGVKTSFYGLTFADAKHGWIVGAEGVVLETTDAGETWKAVASPTTREAELFILTTTLKARYAPQ